MKKVLKKIFCFFSEMKSTTARVLWSNLSVFPILTLLVAVLTPPSEDVELWYQKIPLWAHCFAIVIGLSIFVMINCSEIFSKMGNIQNDKNRS
jgi:hypothetical protein